MPTHPLAQPERLAALRASGLLDSEPEEAFERATRLATAVLKTPVSLVSIVDEDRQFFKSQRGLPEPWATDRQTPLSHSFCQYVVRSEAALQVDDARIHPLVHDNLAIEDLSVIAYLGVPIRSPEGQVLGSFCVIDHEPRTWTAGEQQLLRDIAEQVMSELRLRHAVDDVASLLQQQDDLLDIVAHDVRSPAAAIAMAATTMRRDADNARKAQMLEILTRQSGRIISLAESLLAGTKLEATPVDLAVLVDDLSDAGLEDSSRVVNRVPAGLQVAVPQTAIEQILTNLMDNARRHTQGAVFVDAEHHDGALVVTVTDEGPGFHDAEKLFERGRRGDSTAAGYGLGMYIVRLLCDRLAGGVDIDSGPDRGTTVTVRLPVPRLDRDTAQEATA